MRKSKLVYFQIAIMSIAVVLAVSITNGIFQRNRISFEGYPEGISVIAVNRVGPMTSDLFYDNMSDMLIDEAQKADLAYCIYSDQNTISDNKAGNINVLRTTADYFRIFKPKLIAGKYFEKNGDHLECVIGESLAIKKFGSAPGSIGKEFKFSMLHVEYAFTIAGVITAGEKLPVEYAYRNFLTNNYEDMYIFSDNVVIFDINHKFIKRIELNNEVRTYAIFNNKYKSIWLQGDERDAQAFIDGFCKKNPQTDSFIDFNINPEPELTGMEKEAYTLMLFTFNGFMILIYVTAGSGMAGIQLMSVSRRRREIGLRMAVGANPYSIILMFLKEALIDTVIPASIGLIVGLPLALYIKSSDLIPISIDISGILISISLILLFGIITSLLPVIKAAQIDPVSAMGRTPGLN